MNVCVYGLTHLGRCVAAALASVGHAVRGVDFVFAEINEPGLAELEAAHPYPRSTDLRQARGCDVVWVCHDTPIQAGTPDTEYVRLRISSLMRYLDPGTLVLVSSQLPAGSTKAIEDEFAADYPGRAVTFGYAPENVRVGQAMDYLRHIDRWVVGLRHADDVDKVLRLLDPFARPVQLMTVESAEMVKHAINVWLALSVVYANELAAVARAVGADPAEVASGLLSEARIGPKAYLKPGDAYGGGHLQRDVDFVNALADSAGLRLPLLASIELSNLRHLRRQF